MVTTDKIDNRRMKMTSSNLAYINTTYGRLRKLFGDGQVSGIDRAKHTIEWKVPTPLGWVTIYDRYDDLPPEKRYIRENNRIWHVNGTPPAVKWLLKQYVFKKAK